jgi:hypothetical protein
MEYSDKDVPIECAECSELVEGVLPMVEHILSVHGTSYIPEEAANFARVWADDAYERMELEDIERGEYFKSHGEDPFEPESDKDYGD